jgi:hypothetical protein
LLSIYLKTIFKVSKYNQYIYLLINIYLGTLEAFRESVNSTQSIYNKLSFDKNSTEIIFDIEKEKEVESFFATQRNRFYQLILTQRAGIQHIAVEPTFFWVNHFSSKQYITLIEQEIDICQILQTIDAAVSYFDRFFP